MAASLDYHQQQFGALPHRRPLPSNAQPFGGTVDQYSHSRTRTTSSNVLPPQPYMQPQMPQQLPPQSNRRTLSNATTSTSSSVQPQTLARTTTGTAPSSYASSIRRSTSSRSNNTPSSYVALMRKQKATVWCDRAQHEDPRLLAQQRAAKMRATQEVVGGVSATAAGRSSTSSGGLAGGVRSKIRHHGAVKASAYSGAGNLSGAGVPMRLSASEVEENSEDEDRSANSARYHQRNQSARSSLGSGHRMQSAYMGGTTPTPGGPGARFSSAGSTPPSGLSHSPEDLSRATSLQRAPLAEDETPVPDTHRSDYFTQTGGSGGSGSSEEARFGDIGGLPAKSAARETVHGNLGSADQQRKTSEDLRRRGSVDDRTMTMSGVRLFVANPDLSD